jgi:hypothetical protein
MTIPTVGSVDSTSRLSGRIEGTCKDGQNSLMDSLDLPRLEHITREQGNDEKHDKDKERP